MQPSRTRTAAPQNPTRSQRRAQPKAETRPRRPDLQRTAQASLGFIAVASRHSFALVRQRSSQRVQCPIGRRRAETLRRPRRRGSTATGRARFVYESSFPLGANLGDGRGSKAFRGSFTQRNSGPLASDRANDGRRTPSEIDVARDAPSQKSSRDAQRFSGDRALRIIGRLLRRRFGGGAETPA